MRQFLVVLIILILTITVSHSQELQIHFVDTGQGNCTIVSCPNGNKILVDFGSGRDCNRGETINYVRSILDGELHAVVVSHADSDHYTLIPNILAGITPEVMMRPDGPQDEYGNCNFETWLHNTENSTSTISVLLDADYHDDPATRNPNLDCGGADIYVLAANVLNSFSSKNTKSIVLLIDYGEFEIILTGDATRVTEQSILGWYDHDWLKSEVYQIPHHGSSTTSEDQALGVAAAPRLAIASAGEGNSYGHPRKATFRKLYGSLDKVNRHRIDWCTSQTNCYYGNTRKDIYSTPESGNLIIGSDGSSYWLIERQIREIQ